MSSLWGKTGQDYKNVSNSDKYSTKQSVRSDLLDTPKKSKAKRLCYVFTGLIALTAGIQFADVEKVAPKGAAFFMRIFSGHDERAGVLDEAAGLASDFMAKHSKNTSALSLAEVFREAEKNDKLKGGVEGLREDKVLIGFVTDMLTQMVKPIAEKDRIKDPAAERTKLEESIKKTFGQNATLEDIVKVGYLHNLASRYGSAGDHNKEFSLYSAVRDILWEEPSQNCMWTEDMVRAALAMDDYGLALSTVADYYYRSPAVPANMLKHSMYNFISSTALTKGKSDLGFTCTALDSLCTTNDEARAWRRMAPMFTAIDPDYSVLFANPWPETEGSKIAQGGEKWFAALGHAWREQPGIAAIMVAENQTLQMIEPMAEEYENAQLSKARFLAHTGRIDEALQTILACDPPISSEEEYDLFARVLLIKVGDPRALDFSSNALFEMGLEQGLSEHIRDIVAHNDWQGKTAKRYRQSFVQAAVKGVVTRFDWAVTERKNWEKPGWKELLSTAMGSPVFYACCEKANRAKKLDDAVLAELEKAADSGDKQAQVGVMRDWLRLLALVEKKDRKGAEILAADLGKKGLSKFSDVSLNNLWNEGVKSELTGFAKLFEEPGTFNAGLYKKIRKENPTKSLREFLYDAGQYPESLGALDMLTKQFGKALSKADNEEMDFIKANILFRMGEDEQCIAIVEKLTESELMTIGPEPLMKLAEKALTFLEFDPVWKELCASNFSNIMENLDIIEKSLDPALRKLSEKAKKEFKNEEELEKAETDYCLKQVAGIFYNRAKALESAGQNQTALYACEAAMLMCPDQNQRNSYLNKLYSIGKSSSSSIGENDRVYALASIMENAPGTPLSEQAFNSLVFLAPDRKNPLKVAEYLRSCGQNSFNGKFIKTLDYAAATHLFQKAKYAEAEDVIKYYIQCYQTSESRIYFLRGLCALKQGRNEDGIKDMEFIVANFPKCEQEEKAFFLLGWSYLTGGDKQKAADYFNKLLTQYPQSSYAARAKAFVDRLKE